MDQLQSTLIKLALPIFTIVLVLFVTNRRGFSRRDDLGFRASTTVATIAWIVGWVAWIAVSEIAISAFGLDQAKPWPEYPWLIVILRIAAIGVLGPAAEEIVMRGALLHIIGRTRVGYPGAVFVVAALWAAAHFQYGLGSLVLIFADGVVLGFARRQSGSLWLPIAMHIIGNCFSITQSLTG